MSDFTHYREQIDQLRSRARWECMTNEMSHEQHIDWLAANSLEALLRVAEAALLYWRRECHADPVGLADLEDKLLALPLEQLQERKA